MVAAELSEIASEIILKMLIQKLGKKLPDFMDSIKNNVFILINRKKIMWIGGGEIAFETSVIANRICWKTYCVQSRKQRGPMRVLNMESSYARKKDPEGKRQTEYYDLTEISAVNYLRDTIFFWDPDVIVLEDSFLPTSNWQSLIQIVPDKYKFFPPCDEPKNNEQENAFFPTLLSRSWMKLGIEKVLNLEQRKWDSLIIDENNIINTVDKMKDMLGQNSDGIILKPDVSSSGLGISVIKREEEFRIAVKLAMIRSRVPTKRIIIEPYYDNIKEFFIISVGNKDSNIMIGPIEYKKMLDDKNRLGGPFRLEYAFYPPRTELAQTQIEQMHIITSNLMEYFKLPFIGVEFFLIDDKLHVNEVTWRPDDMGFITMLSHSRSQFEMFLDALVRQKSDSTPLNDDNYVCLPMLRSSPWPGFPCQRDPLKKQDYIIRFYDKKFEIAPRPVEKVMGYLIFNESKISKTSFKELMDNIIIPNTFGGSEVKNTRIPFESI